jgi:hypothetical protein
MSTRFYRNPRWDGALWAVCLVRLLAKERPRAQPEGPAKQRIGQRRGCQDRAKILLEAFVSRCCGVASSFGRNCSAVRGLIRVVAFRASHPAKPPSRQRKFVQRFPMGRVKESPYNPESVRAQWGCRARGW